jgi:Ni/Co efflux regulator RcnB
MKNGLIPFNQGTMMKLRTLPTLLAALALSLPVLSMAQDHHDNDRHDDHGNSAQHRHMPSPRADWNHDGYRHDDYRGAGPRHEFYRGGRLPAEYRGRTYVVNDWRGHNLSAPPRGYHWVQSGSDYVLAAVATGVILDVLLSNQ